MKKLLIFAICVLLTGCQFLDRVAETRPRTDEVRVTTAALPEIFDKPTESMPELDWENVLEVLPALGKYDIIGGFGDCYFGYDNSVMAGDGSNFRYIDAAGENLDIKMPTEELENSVIHSQTFSGGDLYELRRPFGEEEHLYLIRINGKTLETELLGELPYTLERTVLDGLEPMDGGVIVWERTRLETVYKNDEIFERSGNFTAWIYDTEKGLREVINESMTEKTETLDTDGVEVLGVFMRDGELNAVGRGKRDGVQEIVVLRYNLNGGLLGTQFQKQFQNGDLFNSYGAFKVGDGFAINCNGHVIVQGDSAEYISDTYTYARNQEFFVTAQVNAAEPLNSHTIYPFKSFEIYDLSTGESRRFAVDPAAFEGSAANICAADDGFIVQVETGNGRTYLRVRNETLKSLFE